MIALRQRSRAELDRCMLFSLNTRGDPLCECEERKFIQDPHSGKGLLQRVLIWLRFVLLLMDRATGIAKTVWARRGSAL
jgi:hypothetical protein